MHERIFRKSVSLKWIDGEPGSVQERERESYITARSQMKSSSNIISTVNSAWHFLGLDFKGRAFKDVSALTGNCAQCREKFRLSFQNMFKCL